MEELTFNTINLNRGKSASISIATEEDIKNKTEDAVITAGNFESALQKYFLKNVLYLENEDEEINIVGWYEEPINKPLKFTSSNENNQSLYLYVKDWSSESQLGYHPNLEISFDKTNWETWNGQVVENGNLIYQFDEISFTEHPVIYVRGNNPERFSDTSNNWNTDVECCFDTTNSDDNIYCEGNPMSLIGETASVIPCDGCFYSLTGYISAPCYDTFTIPNTIKEIPTNGFAFYFQNTTELKYLGTVDEWNQIILNEYWDGGNKITTIKCIDGTVVVSSYISTYKDGSIKYENEISDENNLVSVIVTDNCTAINYGAFYNCTSLTSITIPDSVTDIGDEVFRGCSSLDEIIVDTNNTVYDSRNNCNAIIHTSTNQLKQGCNNTIIPDSVTSIGYGAFSGYTALTGIIIPDSVASIGYGAFSNCSSLTDITISNSVTSIGNSTFHNCSSLTSIIIPNSVTSIADMAFYNCNSLTSIIIPDSVISIRDSAFYNCSSLTSITCLATTPPNIRSWVFDNTNDCPIYVPAESVALYKGANNWLRYASRIQAIPVEQSNDEIWYTTINGDIMGVYPNVFNANIVSNTYTDNKGVIKFDNAVTTIADSAFEFFYGLTSIIMPSSLTYIGNVAFGSCEDLTSITCLATTPPTIGAFAFADTYCPIYVPSDSVEAYKAAEGWSEYADRIQAITE